MNQIIVLMVVYIWAWPAHFYHKIEPAFDEMAFLYHEL